MISLTNKINSDTYDEVNINKIEKICDQIVLNDVKNANDFVAQLVNQLPTAISNYLKK